LVNVKKNKAAKDNIILEFKAGYRSIDKQRQLFVAELQVLSDQIVAGQADSQVINALLKVVPPGYSRHHTGYAVDIACKNEPDKTFVLTKCHTWLSNNNYHQAKKAGFIPSHSEGIGPPVTDPQVAEYVWVGTSSFN
jgi:D-alanyl-D-alanine carboxypeptidase